MKNLSSFFKRIKREQGGFTLTELLATIVIVSMMSMAVAGGVTVVQRSLEKISLKANSELLLSTSLELIKDELRYAEDVKLTGDTVESFQNNNYGGWRRLLKDEGKKMGIRIHYLDTNIAGEGEGNKNGNQELLVSESTRTAELYTDFENLTFDKEKHAFILNGLKVYKKENGGSIEDGTVMAEIENVTIRPVNTIEVE